MSGAGRLRVIGIGPGADHWITPEAREEIAAADDLVGYAPYLARLSPRDDQVCHASDNRAELARARHALELAASGRHVAVVSGGDPGIFAMAAAVFEAVDLGPAAWRELDIAVVPGISAMQAAAARVGAPLGHDFCVISLSDNLKPWPLVERRLAAAADGGFVMAIYNPASRQRPEQIHRAFAVLRGHLPDETPVIFARAIGRDNEGIVTTTLGAADPSLADMATLVLVGSRETRIVPRIGQPSFVYTPRRAETP